MTKTTKRDYYEVLGVSKTADAAAIKKAYRKLAKKYHPDTNAGDPVAEEKLKEVNEAYDVLGDEKKSSAVDPAEYRKMAAEKAPLYVEAILANGKVYAQKGKIIFFDSTENTQTSSLAMRAEFANPKNDRQLMPGQFVRVRLVGAVYKNAILVPSSAVLNTPEGMLTYVVDSNNTVAARPVKGELQNNMYIISEGLKHGEKIVSNGLIKLKPGMQVTVNLQKFTLPATAQTAQPASQDGRSVASLEATIDKSVAPDAQALPNDQQGK